MLDIKEIVCTGDTLFRNERFMLDEMNCCYAVFLELTKNRLLTPRKFREGPHLIPHRRHNEVPHLKLHRE